VPIVATVLKSGGEFDVSHLHHFVRELALFTQKWTRRNNFVPPRLVCLTDLDPETLPEGVEAIPMVDAWPEPWTVLELFKPGLFAEGEAILYFRLDVELVGEFLPVFDAVDAIDIYRAEPHNFDELASGLTEAALVVDMISASASDALAVAAPGVATPVSDVLAVGASDNTTLTTTEGTPTLDVALTVVDHATVDEATLVLFAALDRVDTPTAAIAELATILATRTARTDAPAAAIVETSTLLGILARTDAPAAAVTDAKALLGILARTDTPAATVTEAKTLLATLGRTDTPTAAIAEARTILATLARGDTPTAALTEAKTLLGTLARADNPTSAITEAKTLLGILSRTDNSTLHVTEAINAIVSAFARTDNPTVAIAAKIDIGAWELSAKTLLASLARADTPSVGVTDHASLNIIAYDIGAWESPT